MSGNHSQSNPRLLQRVRSILRLVHYSPRTGAAYRGWVVRNVKFHWVRHPLKLGERDVIAVLEYLVELRQVAASTQGQSLAARLFLYARVLDRPLALHEDAGQLTRRSLDRAGVHLAKPIQEILGELVLLPIT